eukprot:6041082-Prymnesium_polylepis.2
MRATVALRGGGGSAAAARLLAERHGRDVLRARHMKSRRCSMSAKLWRLSALWSHTRLPRVTCAVFALPTRGRLSRDTATVVQPRVLLLHALRASG